MIDQATNRFVTTNQNFRYDKNGNLTTDGDNREVVFNGENKQHEVKNASGQTIGRYLYDGEGKRVKKITWNSQGASETTIFVYSAGKLVAEYSDTQVPVPNKTTRYLTEDHLDTPRVITDSEGNVISRRDFMPFSEEITPDIGARASVAAYQPTTDNVKQKFTGYQKDDETGLDFAEARMYENRHGRFTAVDPLLASGKSANPQTFNRYSYTSNNPIIRVDRSGEEWYYAKRTSCSNSRCSDSYEPVWRPDGSYWLYRRELWKWGHIYQITGDFSKHRGEFSVLNPFENESGVRGSLGEAQALLEGFRQQAALDFFAGALSGVSMVASIGISLADLGVRNGRMFQQGEKAGTLASILVAIATGGSGVGAKLTDKAIGIIARKFGPQAAKVIAPLIRNLCCFVAGTPIQTDAGKKPIERIKVGDLVPSLNEKTGKIELKRVVSTFQGIKANILKIRVRGEKLLTTTTEHPFYVRSRFSENSRGTPRWITAGELTVGDQVLRSDRMWARVVAIERDSTPTLVYNFEVEDNHNYFVGETGVLTHNCGLGNTIGAKIASGHAFIKHFITKGDLLFEGTGIRTLKQFAEHIDDVMKNAAPSNVRQLANGRTAYWDDQLGMVIIHDVNSKDLGTAFRPDQGRYYFDNVLK